MSTPSSFHVEPGAPVVSPKLLTGRENAHVNSRILQEAVTGDRAPLGPLKVVLPPGTYYLKPTSAPERVWGAPVLDTIQFAVRVASFTTIHKAQESWTRLVLDAPAQQGIYTSIFFTPKGSVGVEFHGIDFETQSDATTEPETPESHIFVASCQRLKVMGCTFTGCRGKALRVDGSATHAVGESEGVRIKGCSFSHGFGQAIHLGYTKGARIKDCKIRFNAKSAAGFGGAEAMILYSPQDLRINDVHVEGWGNICFRGQEKEASARLEDCSFVLPAKGAPLVQVINVDKLVPMTSLILENIAIDASALLPAHSQGLTLLEAITGSAGRWELKNCTLVANPALKSPLLAKLTGRGELSSLFSLAGVRLDGTFSITESRIGALALSGYDCTVRGVFAEYLDLGAHNSFVYGSHFISRGREAVRVSGHAQSMSGCLVEAMESPTGAFAEFAVKLVKCDRVGLVNNNILVLGPTRIAVRADDSKGGIIALNQIRFNHGNSVPSDGIKKPEDAQLYGNLVTSDG